MPSFTKAWSLYPYDTPLREAIALLKYRGKVWNGTFVVSPPHGCIAGLTGR